jgi:hypothetical protein
VWLIVLWRRVVAIKLYGAELKLNSILLSGIDNHTNTAEAGIDFEQNLLSLREKIEFIGVSVGECVVPWNVLKGESDMYEIFQNLPQKLKITFEMNSP